MPKQYEIIIFTNSQGKKPYEKWLSKLRDQRAKGKILRRVERVSLGNFGDHKSVGQGVYELRENYGPGYRVYYGKDGEKLVIILCGGAKDSQTVDIEDAKAYWAEYKKAKRGK